MWEGEAESLVTGATNGLRREMWIPQRARAKTASINAALSWIKLKDRQTYRQTSAMTDRPQIPICQLHTFQANVIFSSTYSIYVSKVL